MTSPLSAVKPRRAPIGRRPGADPATTWVRQGEAPDASAKASIYTARLTIDVTPTLRGRIKVVAFRRGITAADMLRELLEREYPEDMA
ncbi:chromosome partitioning protein ParB [Acidovorax sp. LjRoot129]|uniref:chromosome partitioning protein ParB n=1 Tax=Acidovorax sp. LjRoot129 TaxID=3342260 RepID=UPI003ED043F4